MGIKISAEEFLRAKQLETLGIPLDGEVLGKNQEACRGLWIRQDPIILLTTIFDTISGGTGVQICLSICNEFHPMIRTSAARLDIVWCEQMRWLEDPLRKAPAKNYYSLPMPNYPRLERDLVLNHRFGPNRKLLRGDKMDGFLLGIGEEPIPDQYRDRQLFEARLTIFDGRNNEYPFDVKFLVHREPKRRQQLKVAKETVAVSPSRRRSLSWASAPAENRILEPVT